jgi:hypothetical protein
MSEWCTEILASTYEVAVSDSVTPSYLQSTYSSVTLIIQTGATDLVAMCSDWLSILSTWNSLSCHASIASWMLLYAWLYFAMRHMRFLPICALCRIWSPNKLSPRTWRRCYQYGYSITILSLRIHTETVLYKNKICGLNSSSIYTKSVCV